MLSSLEHGKRGAFFCRRSGDCGDEKNPDAK